MTSGDSLGATAPAVSPERLREIRAGLDLERHGSCVKAANDLRLAYAGAAPAETVYILRNYSAEPLAPYLEMFAGLSGYRIETTLAGFDSYMQELIEPGSALHQAKPSIVVVTLLLENLFGRERHPDSLPAGEIVDHLAMLLDAADALPARRVFVTAFAGGLSSWSTPEAAATVAEVNAYLRERAGASSRIDLIEVGDILMRHGREKAFDRRAWFLFNQPYSNLVIRDLARRITGHLDQLNGRSKKVMVLDCDNTLWGGVLGEDGPEGIKLDAAEYPGNVFHTVQRMLVELSRRGVLIALASKNDEADVLKLLAEHPAAVLKESHLAGWRIDWQDKASNLIALAEELNLGLDSLVFVDDSPTECQLIRDALPEVDVICVPENLLAYPDALRAYEGFPPGRTIEADAARTAQYRAERARRTERPAIDIESFLASLELVAEIAVDAEADLARVAQLTQKTNQFNLTTRRYAESEIEAWAADPEKAVVALTLRDKFGGYGLTGVALLARDGPASAVIDSFLLSCRILGRRIEDVLLTQVARIARERWSASTLIASRLATAKNGQTLDFLDDRGFEKLAETGDRRDYRIQIDRLTPRDVAMIGVEVTGLRDPLDVP